MPGVKPTFPSVVGKRTYLLVLACGGAFVAGGVEVFSPELQPVNTAPITIPNSTIRVYILFIVKLTFTKSPKRTSTILSNSRHGQIQARRGAGITEPFLVA